MLKCFLLAILLLCFSSVSQARASRFEVKGLVTDAQQVPLGGATVILISEKDSAMQAVNTDSAGQFRFTRVHTGNYLLKISFLGFQPYEKKLFVDKATDLGKIQLTVLAANLNEVKVVAEAPPVVQKGDTTEFNAGSFKTNPDASTEDLVKKMPGIEMVDGKVKAQGEKVNKVLVDGKPFFSDDPMTALKTLPAEMVDKIQVFDSKSDQARFTGIEDGQTSKTMNVVTKLDKREGRFGKASAGYGDQDRYMAGLNLNDFNNARRLTFTGLANNINQQNFTGQDNSSKSSGSQQNGVATTQSGGVNYNDNWGSKTQASGSYFFTHVNNQSGSSMARTYLLETDSNLSYKQDNKTNNTSNSHKLSFRIEHTIDSANSLILTPAISIQQSKGSTAFDGQTNGNAGILNQISNSNGSDMKGYDLSNDVLFQHRFRNKKRTFSVDVHTDYARSKGNTTLRSQNQPADTNGVNQNGDMLQEGSTFSANNAYTEPLGAKHNMQLSYIVSLQQNRSEKNTYNYSDQAGQYIIPDSALTNSFKNRFITHKPSLTWQWQNSKLVLSAGAGYQWLQMQNTQQVPVQQNSTRTYGNLLPTATIKFRVSKLQNISLVYGNSTSQPSVKQLQSVINNTNPLQLSTGNPLLKQARQQNLRLTWFINNKTKSNTFFVTLSGTATKNYFANSTSIANSDLVLNGTTVLKKGGQLSMPVNLDGNYSMSAMTSYNFPVRVIKSSLSMNSNYSYNRNPGMVNGNITYNTTQLLGGGFTLSSNISKDIDFTVSSSARYNYTSNSLQANVKVKSFNQNNKASLYWMFYKNFILITEVNHQLYTGLTGGYNRQFVLWNAALAKKFLKKNQLEVKVSVFDLLKQNNSIQRTVSTIYYEDTRTQVLQRYFMLTVSYNIRDFGK